MGPRGRKELDTTERLLKPMHRGEFKTFNSLVVGFMI